TDFTAVCEVKVTEFDAEAFTIKAVGRGEEFEIGKHTQGTEVKAITYHCMRIVQNGVESGAGGHGGGASAAPAAAGAFAASSDDAQGTLRGPVDVFVVLDI